MASDENDHQQFPAATPPAGGRQTGHPAVDVQALMQSEDFLSFALTTAHLGAWDMDLADHTAHRTREHARIFGYDDDAHPWSFDIMLSHILPEDRPRVEQTVRQAVASGREFNYECRIRRRDGKTRWIWVAGCHRTAPGGHPHLVGIIQDITERKHAEDLLHQSRRQLEQERARLQAIIDTIPIGLSIAERSGKVVLFNDELLRIWAGPCPLKTIDETCRYKGFWPQNNERLKPEEWPGVQALLYGKRSKDVVIDIEKFDGSRGTIMLSAAPIQDESGVAAGAVVAAQDITALRQAQARLEEADRRKTHFLAVLSHELRNPLAPVKNSLYILDHAAPGGNQAHRAKDVIARQIDQLTHLVDDLLDITRIARGKIQLQRRRLELNDLVRRTLEDYRSLFEKAGVGVDFKPAPEEIFVDADWNRLAQVVGNLLHNAVKFTPPSGSVTATVAAEPAAKQAVIRVADTGAGMAPDIIAGLFEPFMQADASLARSKGGLGLGLALVKGLVEQHGGTVGARSAGPGQGSEFTVRLPLDVQEPAKRPAPSAAAGKASRRVLIIEDNADAADSLREALEVMGHTVAVAYDGARGVITAREFHPDIVLCDIGLPGMDGYGVARAFKTDDTLRSIRLVALSGYALPEDLQQAAAAGFEQHLAKPANLEKLTEVLMGAALP